MGRKKNSSFCFTEYGVLMLSSVLNNAIAISVNIQIMRVYAKIREMLSTHKDIALKMEQMESKLKSHDDELMQVFNVLKTLLEPEKSKRTKIGFKTPQPNVAYKNALNK